MEIEGIAEVVCMDGQWQALETVSADVTIVLEPGEIYHGSDGTGGRVKRAPKVIIWGEEPDAIKRAVLIRVTCMEHVVEGEKTNRMAGKNEAGKYGVQYTLLR
jgi:hypothetical protein